MQAIYQMIETVAEVQSTVLITGESGTGKELVARAIHDLSPRAEKPFISINCGAFTETLLESELFGYVKGAFTGANTNRKGLFEAANRGTIFLDEIGEMSPAMQVKLLRVLQERKVRPVGAHEEISVDARVIAATNRDLKQMSADGTFREDLFYRISVIPIALPPLRDRREDIPELIDHYLGHYARRYGRPVPELSPAARGALLAYDWPGNVRALRHALERAVILAREAPLEPEDFALIPATPRIAPQAIVPPRAAEDLNLDRVERRLVEEALRKHGYNISLAAAELGLSRAALYRRMEKHGL